MNDRDTATFAHHSGPRRPPSGGVFGLLLLLLAVAAGALALAAAPGAGAASGGAPGAAGPVYTWQEDGGSQSATLYPSQVQVFLKSGVRPAAVGQRLAQTVAGQNGAPTPQAAGRSGAPAPQAVGQGRLLVQVPSGSGTATDRLRRARSALLADPSVADVGAVFYTGSVSAAHRLVATGELVVRFRPSVTAQQRDALCAQLALRQLRAFPFAPGAWLLKTAAPLDVFAAVSALGHSSLVRWAVPSWYRARSERAVPTDPLFSQQWAMLNTGQFGGTPGIDADVTPVYDQQAPDGRPVLGDGSVIAIADDGLQIAHPDLAPNVFLNGANGDGSATGSYDFVDNDRDPSPALADENHGTACAGVAAARGFNGIGISGAAPDASLIGYRFLSLEYQGSSPSVDDSIEAEVLGNVLASPSGPPAPPVLDNRAIVDASSNSWGPTDDRHLEGPGPLAMAALQTSDIGDYSDPAHPVPASRGGLGTVYVWAGGNGRQANDNVDFDGYADSRFTIAVAAVDNRGKVAPYSEDGAPLMICAPSSNNNVGVVTTDRTGTDGYNTSPSPAGDYFSGFGGTSAAAPPVSGVVALMLQVRPDLSWRDVQQILMTTARKNDPTNLGWTTNAAGYHVNHSYGFGLVDAKAAVTAARTWTPVGPEIAAEGTATPAKSIPDESQTGVTSAITLGADQPNVRIEYVEVYFTAPHPRWSDLQVTLTAPSGTQSILATSSTTFGSGTLSGYDNWRFGTARDLGESSRGTWTLTVRDLVPGDVGRFQSWRVRAYGTAIGPDTTPPVTTVTSTRTWWNVAPVLHLRAVDLGSNVQRTEFRIGESSSGAYQRGTTVSLPAPRRTHANDGRHVLWFRSIDNAVPPNVETPKRFVVDIDTRPPLTYAPRPARVRRGASTRLFYRVTDAGFSSHRATVRIRVRDSHGRLQGTITLPNQPTGLRQLHVLCRLPKGVYHFSVYATDTAGNAQARVGVNTLTVH
jgi:subtilisin-like proprotein convertase family protein